MALAHPRIAIVRRASWTAATTGFSFDALEDLDTMVEVLEQVALKDGSEVLALDQETRW